MRITKFRIHNFRSIADSGWITLSEDGINTIVGMNESGKSSLLEALASTLGSLVITSRDLRFGCPHPEIFLEYLLSAEEINEITKEFQLHESTLIRNYFISKKNIYSGRFTWEKEENEFVGYMTRDLDDLIEKLDRSKIISKADTTITTVTAPSATTTTVGSSTEQTVVAPIISPVDSLSLSEVLDKSLTLIEPVFVLFNDESGVLPDTIDVPDYKLLGNGRIGARNFLTVANIDLKKLVDGTDSDRVNLLRRATKKITKDFGDFWSQNIGEAKKLELECEIHSKRSNSGNQAGAPYLSFWITDGVNRLHPSQRSKGLRWFLSFYLQLRASEANKKKRLFLLDEPGANLHETAQSDVLALINTISPSLAGLIYTTHSPHLVEPNQLHRILTVERATDSDESPSIIRNILKNASSCSGETLSPIYTRMGVDFWRQTVIQRNNNVILEEPSGFFYFRAFWLLTKSTEIASFIPCTGVNNIPQLAYMFSGWGLGFCIAVDDEPSGRSVHKELKIKLFGDDENTAKKRLYKIHECAGVEDIFSVTDFQKVVLNSQIENYPAKNSDYLKRNGGSKPLLACRFYLAVEKGEIRMDSFEQSTQNKITETVNAIKLMLN